MRNMLKSKIHRATVTRADLDYVGSIEIDENLMEAADILSNEQVHVWNVTNGERFVTYAVTGERGSGVVCVNGAAAHLAEAGDLVIIATFTELEEAVAQAWQPKVIMVDDRNRIFSASRAAGMMVR